MVEIWWQPVQQPLLVSIEFAEKRDDDNENSNFPSSSLEEDHHNNSVNNRQETAVICSHTPKKQPSPHQTHTDVAVILLTVNFFFIFEEYQGHCHFLRKS